MNCKHALALFTIRRLCRLDYTLRLTQPTQHPAPACRLNHGDGVAANSPCYSYPPKVSDKARRRRQYAFVRRGDATQYEVFGGWL